MGNAFIMQKNGGIYIELTEKALLNINEICEYLGIGKTKARELLHDRHNGFAVRIGNRLYAHKGRLDDWLLAQVL